MPGTGVVVMEMMMPVPLGAMIGTVLGAAVEAFLVRPLVPSVGPIMEPLVARVVTGMPVIVVMCKAGHRRNDHNQDGSR